MSTAKVAAFQGDITTMKVDGIVNAAKPTLLGGGGVDGAIHDAAGPELLEYCQKVVHRGCHTGDAVVTPGFHLPAKYVIHTVGPIWRGGDYYEEDLLRCCYRRCIEEADLWKMESIAFPAISTGVYGFPHAKAADIAVYVTAHMTTNVKNIYLVAFDAATADLYKRMLPSVEV